MTTESKACGCAAAPKLVFPCSGAADVGEIADRAGRKLTREGHGKMFCLAGVGGAIPNILTSTRAADTILAIDGCPTNCVKATLEKAGITHFQHLQLADLDLPKGKSPATEEAIGKVAAAGAALLSKPCC
ncbi:MAG: putative zinc-binding protein [Spirochaetes bacterium]|nr:putative zinc-binding protein [Spirochaetota bacterium]